MILYVHTIDLLSYWTWHCITSFIDHTIYVGQKDNANQWKVTVLKEFLHTVSSSYCQNYKRFSCTLTILRPR